MPSYSFGGAGAGDIGAGFRSSGQFADGGPGGLRCCLCGLLGWAKGPEPEQDPQTRTRIDCACGPLVDLLCTRDAMALLGLRVLFLAHLMALLVLVLAFRLIWRGEGHQPRCGGGLPGPVAPRVGCGSGLGCASGGRIRGRRHDYLEYCFSPDQNDILGRSWQ